MVPEDGSGRNWNRIIFYTGSRIEKKRRAEWGKTLIGERANPMRVLGFEGEA